MGIDFDNADDLVGLGDKGVFTPTGSFSITGCFFARTVNPEDAGMISKWKPSQLEYLVRIYQGVIRWHVFLTANNSIDSASISANTWTHFVCTYNSSLNEIDIFIDSVGTGSPVSTSGSITDGTAELEFGRYNSSNPFDGILSDVVFYSVVLSQAEINQLYNSRIKYMPLQIQPSNFIGYWPMNDGSDGTSADGDTIRDLSGNGNDGTGDDGANNTGLTWKAEEVLSYPAGVLPVTLSSVLVGNPWYYYAQQRRVMPCG